MDFDWQRFLDANAIEYVTSGPNVSRGFVAVHCPLCGADDPSQHMTINLSGRFWRCWRHPDRHSGRNPARLVQLLLNCTWEQAQRIVGDAVHLPPDLALHVASLLQPPQQEQSTSLSYPPEFKPVRNVYPSARPYINYLYSRGFTPELGPKYRLKYATRGAFKGRVIFPVHYKNQLVAWTGRTIWEAERQRYKAEGEMSKYLLWYDLLLEIDADTICLCEGPFDALKVMQYGRSHGIVATCFFTAAPSRVQVDLLHELLPRFKYKRLLLDQGTTQRAMEIAATLRALDVSIAKLPANTKDPAELQSARKLKEIVLAPDL